MKQIVSAEVWAVVSRAEIQETISVEGDSLIKMEVVCPPTFLQYLPREDEVLVNFGRGHVRFKRIHFLMALATILPDLIQASLGKERGED